MKELRNGLFAHVLAGRTTAPDEGRAGVRRYAFSGLKDAPHEGRERNAMRLSLFHFFAWNRKHVVFDPVPANLDGLDRAKHRSERPEEKKLCTTRRVDEYGHDFRQRFPIDRRHRRNDCGRKDFRNAVDWVVMDVSGANSEVHDLSNAHKHALQRGLMAVVFNASDGLNEERRGNFVDLSVSDRPDYVLLEAALFCEVGNDPPLFESAPELEGISKDVAARRFEAGILAFFSSDLPGSN